MHAMDVMAAPAVAVTAVIADQLLANYCIGPTIALGLGDHMRTAAPLISIMMRAVAENTV